jgi:diaminopimelate epimerase
MNTPAFTKVVASGNDFIVLDFFKAKGTPSARALSRLAKTLCARKLSVGADGILVLSKPAQKTADFAMRIFNPDGTEAEMCGNGARALALYAFREGITGKNAVFSTRAGTIESRVKDGGRVMIKMMTPRYTGARNVPYRGTSVKGYFIVTGVPHLVVFVKGLSRIDVVSYARPIRRHALFAPKGTNVDFVEIAHGARRSAIALRTYERGVEDETLSCGSGVVSSACVYLLEKIKPRMTKRYRVAVRTQSTEMLTVFVDYDAAQGIRAAYLEGGAKIVYRAQAAVSQ